MMNAKFLCFGLALGLLMAGNVLAENLYWIGDVDSAWTDVDNWGGYYGGTTSVPTSADSVRLEAQQYNAYGGVAWPSITTSVVCENIYMGWEAGKAELYVDGGSITMGWSDLGIGWQNGEGYLEMTSGSINSDRDMLIGRSGVGTFEMSGGTVNVENFWICREPTGVGHVQLDGGVVNATAFEMTHTSGGIATADITGGMMIILGDETIKIGDFITDGWLTAYGGAGSIVMDYDVTNAGMTTITAVPEPMTLSLLGLGFLAMRSRRKR